MQAARQVIKAAIEKKKTALTEYESKKILATYGIPVTREELVSDPGQAVAAARGIGFPVALKVCSDEVAHKTELGLIELGVADEAGVEEACARLLEKAPAGAGILVQEMVPGRRELVAGLVRDPGMGPVVMLGLGGIFAEALADVSFRVAPLRDGDVREMAGELMGKEILGAFRGMPAVDMQALTDCLTALGSIGLDHPEVMEIDINPLILSGDWPVAVDALVVLGEPRTVEVRSSEPRGSLKPFFEPESVAVIGASATRGKPGNDVVRNILANGFEGPLYPVNPKGGEIEGQMVYTSISALPEEIDLGIVVLPAKANPQTIRDLAARGVKAVVLAAGGFAEVDDAGKALQDQTLAAIQESGIRALGPNTSGHISTPAHFTSSFFPLGRVPRGNISYIAQTGNFATHTMRYIMSNEHYGVARVVGVGNKLDIEESEVLAYLAEDRETKGIFMYLESLKEPRRFLEVARDVTSEKPVVMLKGGASREGAQAAVAHTAALAADDRIVDGALRQAGVVRVYKYSHLFMAAKAFAAMPLPLGNRIGFSAPSGAMLVCMTDVCRRLGLEISVLQERTRQRLQDISPPYVRMRNPVDIWPAAAVHGVEFAYRESTDAIMADEGVDAAVVILMLTDETGMPPLDFLVDLAETYPQKPLYVTFTGQKERMTEVKEYLEPRGVPTFPLIEDPFEVLDILCRCGRALERRVDRRD